MRHACLALASSLVLLTAGASPSRPTDPGACALLTAAEVEAATGWKPKAPENKTYGSTQTCRYVGPSPKTQVVVVVLTRPGPKVASSAAMAEWRTKRAAQLDLQVHVKPVEGLGVPAIRTDEGSGPPTIEAAVKGRLLGVSAPSFELARTLAAKAVTRVS